MTGAELAGEWDEASHMAMTCCIFMAMRGDQLITIDFTATPATLRQAATLVDSAYKRMEQPLQVSVNDRFVDKERAKALAAAVAAKL